MNENADIPDLARRVLGADKVGRDTSNAASWDAVDLVLENAPALARAVVAAADLADELREVAHESYLYCKDDAGDAYQDAADRITAALNGDPDA